MCGRRFDTDGESQSKSVNHAIRLRRLRKIRWLLPRSVELLLQLFEELKERVRRWWGTRKLCARRNAWNIKSKQTTTFSSGRRIKMPNKCKKAQNHILNLINYIHSSANACERVPKRKMGTGVRLMCIASEADWPSRSEPLRTHLHPLTYIKISKFNFKKSNHGLVEVKSD